MNEFSIFGQGLQKWICFENQFKKLNIIVFAGAHQPIPPLNYHYSYGSHGKILYHPLGPLLPAYDFNGYPIGVPRVHDNVLRNGQPVLPHEGQPEYDPLPPHNTISVPPFEDAGGKLNIKTTMYK